MDSLFMLKVMISPVYIITEYAFSLFTARNTSGYV